MLTGINFTGRLGRCLVAAAPRSWRRATRAPTNRFHFADTAAVGVGSTWHGGKHRTVKSARTARGTLQRRSEDFPRKSATFVTDKFECQKESLGEGLWTPPRPWGVMGW